MNWKKTGKRVLFPHIAVMIVLIPIATAFLVYSMVFLDPQSPISIVSYIFAFYTLTVWCVRIPDLISFVKAIKNKNKYARMWRDDLKLRMNVFLYVSLIWNVAYALFQLGLGFFYSSFWFFSMAGYYIFLAVMRFFLLGYTRKNVPGDNMRSELLKYRVCGWVFLAMNLTVSLIIFFMVYWGRSFVHHEITAIALAAYTFTSFTAAIVNIVKHRRYNSPVYFASKAISLAAACVSMLTLESTMLTAFGSETTDALTRNLLLGTSGGAISVFIVAMAIYMIIQSTKRLKLLNNEVQNNG